MGPVADAAVLGAAEPLAQAGQVDEVGLQREGQLVEAALLRIAGPARPGEVPAGHGVGEHHVLVPVDPAVAVQVGLVQRGVASLVDFQDAGNGDGRFLGRAQDYGARPLLLLLLDLSLSVLLLMLVMVLMLVVDSTSGCGSGCRWRCQGEQEEHRSHRRRCRRRCLPQPWSWSCAHFCFCFAFGKRYPTPAARC